MAKPESRFKTEYPSTIAGDIVDGIIATMTFGLAEPQTECKVTDTKTGETHIGYGENHRAARESAHSKFRK